MRVLTLAAVFGVLAAAGLTAAPVPKQKEKTAEEKLLGKWKLVKSDLDLPVGFDFVIEYKAKGEMSFTRTLADGTTDVAPGKYKLDGADKLEWSVTENGTKRGETSKIKVLEENKLVLEDPDGIKEVFERVVEKKKDDKKEEPKKEPKKD